MALTTRAPGFYWVRFVGYEDWSIARYYVTSLSDGWNICGREELWDVSDFAEIGPRVEPPV